MTIMSILNPPTAFHTMRPKAPSSLAAPAPQPVARQDTVTFSGNINRELARLELEMKRKSHQPEFQYLQRVEKDALAAGQPLPESFLRPEVEPDKFFYNRLAALTLKRNQTPDAFTGHESAEMDLLYRMLRHGLIKSPEDQQTMITVLSAVPFIDAYTRDLFVTAENQLTEEFQGYADKQDSRALARLLSKQLQNNMLIAPPERQALNELVRKINERVPPEAGETVTLRQLQEMATLRLSALFGLENLLRYTDY